MSSSRYLRGVNLDRCDVLLDDLTFRHLGAGGFVPRLLDVAVVVRIRTTFCHIFEVGTLLGGPLDYLAFASLLDRKWLVLRPLLSVGDDLLA